MPKPTVKMFNQSRINDLLTTLKANKFNEKLKFDLKEFEEEQPNLTLQQNQPEEKKDSSSKKPAKSKNK